MGEICLKLTIKTPEQRPGYGVQFPLHCFPKPAQRKLLWIGNAKVVGRVSIFGRKMIKLLI